MLLKMIEEDMQIDKIVFLDTTVEFPQMYEHIKKVEKYIGRKITKLSPDKNNELYIQAGLVLKN
jgi:3'-phosphoadenosine 5'-phosphosulfate sulfotransferase (PAPS reductase)/FAD synthetase